MPEDQQKIDELKDEGPENIFFQQDSIDAKAPRAKKKSEDTKTSSEAVEKTKSTSEQKRAELKIKSVGAPSNLRSPENLGGRSTRKTTVSANNSQILRSVLHDSKKARKGRNLFLYEV